MMGGILNEPSVEVSEAQKQLHLLLVGVRKIGIGKFVQMGTCMWVLIHQLSGPYMGISNSSHCSPTAPDGSVLTTIDTTESYHL